MQIDSLTDLSPVSAASGGDPVALEQRLGLGGLADTSLDEGFYAALLAHIDAGNEKVFDFLTQYRDATGERPYATNGPQMEVLIAAMARMKEEGLHPSPVYDETNKAFATVFGVKGFINEMVREMFDPQAIAEQTEASSW